MKTFSALCLIAALPICFTQIAHGQGNPEATRLAKEGAQANKNQDWDKAIDAFRKATAIDRKNASNLAAVLQKRDYDKALADYSDAIKERPNEVRYLLTRSYIFELKGDFKNSMADTEKVLQIEKKNREALSRKARIEGILKQRASPAPNPPPPGPAPGKKPKA